MLNNVLTKEIIIKNITMNEFKEKIRNNYDASYKEVNLSFNWKEVIEETFSYFDVDKTTINNTFNCIKATISSCKNGEEDKKEISLIIKEKEEDIELILKGDSSIQTKVRAKLLGKSTSNETIKSLWRNTILEFPNEKFDVKFLLWLINNYKNDVMLIKNNFQFKIINIPFVSDKGIHMSNVKRKGTGKKLIGDPIIKAIIATIETIDAVGLKISFEGGEIEFILNSNGEIEISPETDIRSPLALNLKSDYGFEKITAFIKNIILKNLKELYDEDIDIDSKIQDMKLEYLSETMQDMSKLVGIEFEKRVTLNSEISKIILE